MSDPTVHARKAVHDLIAVVEQLAASLLPGTARAWSAPRLSAARRAELDRQAREELDDPGALLPAHLRQTQRVTAPGEHPVPFDLDVMDQLVEIMNAGDLLADDLYRVTWHPPLPWSPHPGARSAFEDPRPALRRVLQLLPQATAADDTIPFYVENRCKALIDRAESALGLVTDGQLLDGLCPWCGGKTDHQPVGGARTLRVRNLPHLGGPVLICEGGHCEPPDAECGARVRGLPAWPQWEWDWVAIKFGRAASA